MRLRPTPPELYNAFVRRHPGDNPRFAVLFTWIHPCRACTLRIMDMFGRGGRQRPVWDIPTYIGHRTQGEELNPPLTQDDREAIYRMLDSVFLPLYRIGRVLISLHEYAVEASIQESTELCDSCALSIQGINNNINNNIIFNCPSIDVEIKESAAISDVPSNLRRSATGKTCKSISPCGYYGKDYLWCHTTDGIRNWDYCCTGPCGIHSSKGYDWCTSGSKWSQCKVEKLPNERYTYNLKQCRSTHKCGFYNQDYAWCYTTDGSWDYCCTQECGLHGWTKDWCTIGNSWKYCKRQELPDTSVTEIDRSPVAAPSMTEPNV